MLAAINLIAMKLGPESIKVRGRGGGGVVLGRHNGVSPI